MGKDRNGLILRIQLSISICMTRSIWMRSGFSHPGEGVVSPPPGG